MAGRHRPRSHRTGDPGRRHPHGSQRRTVRRGSPRPLSGRRPSGTRIDARLARAQPQGGRRSHPTVDQRQPLTEPETERKALDTLIDTLTP